MILAYSLISLAQHLHGVHALLCVFQNKHSSSAEQLKREHELNQQLRHLAE